MAKEKIVEIKGIEDYYVSDKGNIYSTKISYRYNPTGEMRLVIPKVHRSGYHYIGIYIGKRNSKKRLWFRVHRLVYEAFVGNIDKGLEIDHISGDKSDNRIKNLRAITRSENMLAMYKRKRKQNANTK